MKKYTIPLLLFWFCSGILQAQQARQYSYTHYNNANGLASNFVYRVTQDQQGFIWIATVNGLQRFDGKEFITFRHNRNEPGSIPANNVASVYCDKKGRVWIINEDNTVGMINTSKLQYQPVSIRMPPRKARIFMPSKFFEDWRGKLFLRIAAIGIFELDQLEMTFKPTSNIKVPDKWFVLDITPDFYRECFWIGCDSGLARYQPSTQQVSYADHNTFGDAVIEAFKNVKNIGGIMPVENSNDFVCNSWPPSSGNPFLYLYRATPNKLMRFDLGNILGVGYHEIENAFHQKSGPIWAYGLPFAGTIDTALGIFKPLSQLVAQNGQIRFDRANSIFEDRQHNLWLCTTDGIYVFNPDHQPFDSYNLIRPGSNQPREGAVTSVVDINHQLWVGTWGAGLYLYDSLLNPLPIPAAFKPWQDHLTIWYIHEHSRTGKVVLGEQGGRMKVYDPYTGKVQDQLLDVFKKSTIRQIAEDKEGNLWYGTQSGKLIRWDYQKSHGDFSKGYEEVMAIGLVHRLYMDTDGSLWAATMGNGLYHINPVTRKIIDQVSTSTPGEWKLGTDSPIDILRYNDSLLIVPGFTVTVLNTRRRRGTVLSLDDGLPSNTAYYVQKDNQGKLWLGLQNGLCRWNVEKNSFTLFDRRDGIVYDNLTSGGAFRVPGNRLAFTSDHNFVVFNPSKVVTADKPARVQLTNIYRLNKRLPVDSVMKIGNLELDYERNSVVIDYSTLQFPDHGQQTYYHKLEGLDKDWVRSTTNKAIYNYLPYRSYTFKVKSVNADGASAPETSLMIHVKPPFYRAYWFMALMVFIGIGFLYWLDRLRLQKLRATESIRSRIASSLTDDLTNSLSSINISSELAKTKVNTDANRTRDFIHHISETSNRMTQAMYDMVWSINPQNDQMQKTLERMKQYAMEQESISDTNITIEADPAIRDRQSDMEHRYELLSIFKESISNAVRHSGGKNIHVQLRLRKNKLLLLVQDDGRGFDLSTVPLGRGLNDMRRRAEAIGAQLDILSEINTGTLIRLEMKLKG
ncbi:ligand-binding sensor domain-containing protein [Flavihumibacter petaseus]|uniref:Putative two-component histidine kinase n=1 Tax=Flavihumibacter petaseus NBRC 106054 TaxID=1220578 RepID=A0A0E9N4A2_9BACT|nr:sensor histidine kinase [Flavihumibacter petaseus]GAO44618.1 putative two-component histidine kinase [Flavihumibacter petaseus NBRC 106054]